MANLGDRLYQAFSQAETGGEPDPWIRTKIAPSEGSTAYGPVQITRTLAEDYLANSKNLFTAEEISYLQRFIQQGEMFAKFGKNPNLQGYDPRYDYGGSGDLTTADDRRLYEDVAKKMLVNIFTENSGDLEAATKEWRFGAASQEGRQDDVRYFDLIENEYNSFIQQQPTQQPQTQQNAPQNQGTQPQQSNTNVPQNGSQADLDGFSQQEQALIYHLSQNPSPERTRQRVEQRVTSMLDGGLVGLDSNSLINALSKRD